jgi:hypothetical protein
MNDAMKTQVPSVNQEQVAAVCMKEISLSEAIVPEAKDDVVHFCSPDCYQKWHQQQGATPQGKSA